MIKELEIPYGMYKENNMKEVEGSYNKETKTIKVKIAYYVVEYAQINRRRNLNNKIKELSEIIEPIGECEEIRIGALEVEKKYFVYELKSNTKTEINLEERKYFVCVPVELIDKFLKLERGKFQKIYAEANDIHPTFIELRC